MRVHNTFRSAAISLFVAGLLATLAACGGSGDGTSSAGGSGGAEFASATISGNVNDTLAQNNLAPQDNLIASMLEKLVSKAYGAGVAGVVVELYFGGTLVDSQSTGASGEFSFSGLIPGNYSIGLMQNGQSVGTTPTIELAANTNTRLQLRLDGAPTNVEVEANNAQISGQVNDGSVSSDDDFSDDDSSDDDFSDDDSSDDD